MLSSLSRLGGNDESRYIDHPDEAEDTARRSNRRYPVFDIAHLLALFLLLSLGYFYWVPLVFPLWVLLISVYTLLANLWRSSSDD